MKLIKSIVKAIILKILIFIVNLSVKSNINKISEAKRILVMRRGAIGDVLMSTPFLRALRNNFASAHIAYAVGEWSKEVLENNPCINEIISIKSEEWFNWKTNILKKIKIMNLLKKKRFDAVFILNTPWILWSIVAYLTGAKYRIGFAFKNDRNSEFLLTHRSYLQKGSEWDTGDKHRVEHFLDLLRIVNVENITGNGLEMKISDKDEKRIELFLKESNIMKEELIIGVAPGGANNPGTQLFTKRWHKERFAEVCDNLVEKHKAKVIFIGDSADVKLINQIMRSMKSKSINAASKLSIKESAALVKACDLFISNDSAPMHFAVAVETPVLAIFGPTNPKTSGPLGNRHIVLRKDVGCTWPCRSNCKDFDCMSLITVKDVMAAVEKQLKDCCRYKLRN